MQKIIIKTTIIRVYNIVICIFKIYDSDYLFINLKSLIKVQMFVI